MKATVSFLTIVLFLSIPLFGIGQKIQFSDMVCEYEGIYDPGKYTKKQLMDTRKVLESNFVLSFDEELDQPEYSLQNLHDNYNEKMAYLSALNIVDDDFFKRVVDTLHRSLNFQLAAYTAYIMGYTDPTILLAFPQSESCLEYYAKPLLAGKNKLYDAYKKLTLKQMENNSSPAKIWENYTNAMASPQRDSVAFDTVLRYGWWNCINRNIPYLNQDLHLENAYLSLFEEVKTVQCDDI